MSSKNTNQLFISNFPRFTTKDDLEKDFKKFGKITEIFFKENYAFLVTMNPFLNLNIITLSISNTAIQPEKLWEIKKIFLNIKSSLQGFIRIYPLN